MSKELKLGIISLIAIAGAILGYQYLKGKNVLSKGNTYKTVYQNIEGLKPAAPVEINGFVVGTVSNISLDPENVKNMIITFDIQGDWKVPKDAKALLAADNSLVGSKKIILDYDKACSGADCAENGDFLTPGTRGVIEAILGTGGLQNQMATLKSEAGPIIDTLLSKLTGEDSNNAVSNSIQSLEESMSNLASLTANLDALMRTSYKNLNTTIENMAVVSTSLANTNDDLEGMIGNFSTLSQQLVDADLGTTLGKTSETFDNTNALLKDLQETVDQASLSFDNVNELLAKIENGEGSVGKLINDPEIYNNLEETSKHLALLLQDLRLNPKRYVRLSVFGRKGNAYTYPEEDPAYEEEPMNNDKEN